MECAQRRCQPFVIAGQTAKTCNPGKTSFHHPAAWQQHKAVLGLSMLDDFQTNAVFGRGFFGSFAGVALIDISQFDMLPRDFLHLCGQFSHLSAILLVGWPHM